MPTRARSRPVNPLVGVYFGIFVAGLIAVTVLLLILEQLGLSESRLRGALTLGALGLFATIGVAAYTNAPGDFFLAGRRVPSFHVGLAVAVAAMGGTGLVAFSGAIFLAGFDALCLPLGIVAGFVAMVSLIAPYLRKFGAFTVPGYLGMRFDSTTVRLLAASAAAAPLILLIVAEIKVAVIATQWLTDLPEALIVLAIAASLIATLTPGGVRSLSWSGAAQSMAALIALLIPATIVAVIETNLPLGQMSHGPVLRALGRTEFTQGLPASIATALTFDLPGQEMLPIAGRFAAPFASVGPAAFVLVMLTVMLGIAASPAHLGRAATAPSVYQSRKSIGWSVFLVGVVLMTLSGLAVFYRELLMTQLVGLTPDALPAGLKSLIGMRLAEIEPRVARLGATSVHFKRDGVLLGLPVLMGFPASLVFIVAAGVLAAALAGAAASLIQLGIIVAEDVVGGPPGEPRPPRLRLMTARGAIAAVAAAAAWIATLAAQDPLDLMLWSLELSAAGLFPVLLLSIWWKRVNALGAIAGLATGFTVTVLGLLAGGFEAWRLPAELAAVFGVPAALAATIAGSYLGPVPGRHVLEMVRDLRIPGGETIYDREMRLARQKRPLG